MEHNNNHPPPWWSSSSSSDDSLQTRVNHFRLLFGIANYVMLSELCDTASSSSSRRRRSLKRHHRRGCVSFAKKRTVPVPSNVSSDEEDKPSASNETKDLAGDKRPKTDNAVVVTDKKVVVTEGAVRFAMKRTVPDPLDVSSDEDEKPCAFNGTKDLAGGKWLKTNTAAIIPDKKFVVTEELMMRSAKMYQEYMKQIPIPVQRGSVMTFSSWSGLAKSIKQLYQQPLHYLTNVRVKEWDQMRSDADIKAEPLDSIIHPCKAETNIWLLEEVHRLTPSYQFLAKLWLADPMYNASIDSVFP